MKKLLTFGRLLALPLLWLGGVAGLHAQSLGTPTATAWIGRPLDMTVPARLASADGRDACVHADVFFGDARLPPGRVRATLVGSEPRGRSIRVETDTAIDEPVVTVAVRAGCGSAVTRSYTLLPEMPSGTVPATAVAALAPKAPTPPRAQRPRTVPVAAARGSRLRLEPLDVDGGALLRVSARLADPAGDAARRATAAMLWQAIEAEPPAVLRTASLLQDAERDLAQLRQDAGRTRADMAAVRQRLAAGRSGALSPLVLQLLAVLLLSAAAAAGVAWWRTWREEGGHESALAPAPFDPVFHPTPEACAPVAAPAGMPARASVATTARPGSATAPVAPRRADGALRVETLAATFEEVEFLLSLGLAVDAADVLKAYLHDSHGPAPIAFFELIRLCEHERDHAAADKVRRRHAEVFGVEAPVLDHVTAPVGLDGFPALSERVTAAWNTPQVQGVIEEALFAAPEPDGPLTLLAGRDLLCLHEVAANLALEARLPGGAAGEALALAPWAQAEDPARAQLAMPGDTDAAAGGALGVDIDLGVAAAPATLPAPSPLVEEMHAAAREAEARAAALRKQQEEEEAFSAVMASERVHAVRR